MSTSVQKSGKERLQELKDAVTAGLAVCLMVGGALREIRDCQLYALEGHKTFDAFLDHEWGWSLRYGQQLILEADAINALPPAIRKLITTHNQARELLNIPPSLRPAVVDVASAGGTKRLTGQSIKKAAGAALPPRKKKATASIPKRKGSSATPPKPKPPTDATGVEIPVEILGTWNRGPEAQELIAHVRILQSAVKRAQDAGDQLYAEFDFSKTLADLSSMTENFGVLKPHAVCPSCNGMMAKGCSTCKGRGFVSKFYWDHCVPEETKALRTKAA